MIVEHPTWCSPRRCRAAIGGTHHGDVVEVRDRDIRVTAWLQQRPDDEPIMGWATAYRLMAGPVAYLPLPKAQDLVTSLTSLVDQARASAGERP